MNKKSRLSTYDIVLIAILAVILFVQEELLTFLPNIQLTVFLLVLYSKQIGLFRTSFIVLIHVILDNLVMGSFNFLITPFMFIGWLLIPITLNTIFKKVDGAIPLAFIGAGHAFVYCWLYAIPQVIIMGVDLWVYLAADFIFEVILAVSSFISILLLYDPCARIFAKYKNIG